MRRRRDGVARGVQDTARSRAGARPDCRITLLSRPYEIASLYPTLYRLEDDGLLEGRWVEKAGQRRRRYYRLTPAGRKRLASERSVWQAFFVAIDRVAGFKQP